MTPEQHERLVRVEDDVRLIRQDMNKFKGFVGGVIFVVSSMWAIVVIYIRKFS